VDHKAYFMRQRLSTVRLILQTVTVYEHMPRLELYDIRVYDFNNWILRFIAFNRQLTKRRRNVYKRNFSL